jgi:uncharacterized protein YdaT
MPWDARSFAEKHNHKLKGPAAAKAADQATTLVNKGMPEGEAIAIANKTGDKAMRPKGSPKSRAEHMGRLTEHHTQSQVGKLFGKHRSTVSRSVMRQGFTGGGSARD